MKSLPISFHLIPILLCAAILVACSGSSGSSGGSASNNATLSDLTISTVQLDQIFQSNQLDYTVSVKFLTASVTVTATTANPQDSLTIDGQTVASTTSSSSIELAEGSNIIEVTVTAADGTATQTYTVTITRDTADNFIEQKILRASDAAANDLLGNSIAIDGDTIVVGAPFEDGVSSSTIDSGAVYIFTNNTGVWTEQAILRASNAGVGDNFGFSVAITGDTVVVGAMFEDGAADNTNNAGATYVFSRNSDGWIEDAILRASNAGDGDNFGYSVAIADDTMVIGAWHGGEATSDTGVAYIFTRNAGSWNEEAILSASNAGPNDLFGNSVAIDGDTVVVGAYAEDGADDGLTDQTGAVYVFSRDAGAWNEQAMLRASNAGAQDFFGYSVAVDGDIVVVGALGEDGPADSTTGAGAAYLFFRTTESWSELAIHRGSDVGVNDNFGNSVAIVDNTLVVGANRDGGVTNTKPNAGAAYVWQ